MSTCRSVLEGCSRPKKYFPACIEINWNFFKRNLIFPPVSSSFDILHAHYVCESFFVRGFRWNSQWSRSVSLKMFKNTLPKKFHHSIAVGYVWARYGNNRMARFLEYTASWQYVTAKMQTPECFNSCLSCHTCSF